MRNSEIIKNNREVTVFQLFDKLTETTLPKNVDWIEFPHLKIEGKYFILDFKWIIESTKKLFMKIEVKHCHFGKCSLILCQIKSTKRKQADYKWINNLEVNTQLNLAYDKVK